MGDLIPLRHEQCQARRVANHVLFFIKFYDHELELNDAFILFNSLGNKLKNPS